MIEGEDYGMSLHAKGRVWAWGGHGKRNKSVIGAHDKKGR